MYGGITPFRLLSSSSLNYIEQNQDNGNYQQDVNQPSHRVATHQSQHPQNYQYHSDRPQHTFLLSVCFRVNARLRTRSSRQRSRVDLDSPMVISLFTLYISCISLRSLLTRSFPDAFQSLRAQVPSLHTIESISRLLTSQYESLRCFLRFRRHSVTRQPLL